MAQSEAQSWIDALTCTAEANIASAALPHGFAAERPVVTMALHVIAPDRASSRTCLYAA